MIDKNNSTINLPGLEDCQAKIKAWLTDPCIEQKDKQEILQLIQQEQVKELRDRFYKDVEFGTGGMRGIMGQGFNRLNQYIVRRAIQGFANYILKCGTQNKGVAIAYDSRHQSEFFAQQA